MIGLHAGGLELLEPLRAQLLLPLNQRHPPPVSLPGPLDTPPVLIHGAWVLKGLRSAGQHGSVFYLSIAFRGIGPS